MLDMGQYTITDFSIVARWDPRNAAEVFLYTKIIPQPGEKVPLLHLHALVTKKTLIRAIPLLPDGSSPRASPGILALGIPVVCGRRRGTTQAPVSTRRAGEITLDDGVCIGEEEEAVQAQVPSPGSIDLEMPTAGHEACRGQSGGSGQPVICGDTVEARSVGERVQLLGTRGEGLPPLLGVADEVVPPGGRELACEHAFRAFSVGGSVGLHGGGRKLAWGENNGGRSDAYREGKPDCDSRVPLPVGPDSSDGAAVITGDGIDKLSVVAVGEKLNGMADTSAFVPLDTSYHSLGQSDDQVVPIGGRVGGVVPDEEECLGIRMTTGDGKLSVAFPEKVGDCAFVIEIMLSVEPAYIEGKAYKTFIFAGLPRCKNPVYIDFRIRDTSDWQFTTLPTLDLCGGDGSKFTDTRLRGTLDTSEFNQNTPKNLFIRALRCPTSPEAQNFEMKIETRATFAWRCSDGQIIAEFDIRLEFPGIVPEIGPERNQVHLFITNGPDNQDDLIVESPNSDLVEFSLGEREFVKDNLGRMVKLLQVDRLMKDVGNSLRVCFRKEQGMAPQTVDIPTIRAGGESKIISEMVSIQTPKLPLLVTCSPDKLFWQEFLTQGIAENSPATRFMRLRPEAGEEFLRVRIDSLTPAHLIANEELEREGNGYHNFVDQVTYIIEDSVDAGNGFPSVGVSMRFSLGVPLTIEPMDEIIRVHSGDFRLNFVTINHIFVGRGVVFEDGSEVILLNYDLIEHEDDGNSICKREERLMIRIEWSNETNQILPHRKVQYRLPQVSGKVIGRAVVKCSNREARVIYRAQGLFETLNVSSELTRGRVILAGLGSKSRDLFFEIPYGFKSAQGSLRALQEFEQGQSVSLTPNAPNGGDQTRHSLNAETGRTSCSLVSHPGMSITLTDPGLQSPMPQGEGRTDYITGHNHRRRSSKWLFAVFLVLILAANFLGQMNRIDGLKGWLRRNETMLKEVESSHRQLLLRLASAAQQEPEGAGRYVFVIGRLGPHDLLAIVPAPTTESGRKDMLAAGIKEQGWRETEIEEERLQDAYPVKVPYEDTGRSLAHHRGAARVLQEVPLSGTFERVMVSTLDYLWGLVLRAYRGHSNNNRAAE